ncbi:MAG: hypothetical protein HQ521_05270 [Bacteroidetes bacterium]|nr:hypothetical protein [Bacteroidota bacterium]
MSNDESKIIHVNMVNKIFTLPEKQEFENLRFQIGTSNNTTDLKLQNATLPRLIDIIEQRQTILDLI